MGEYTIIVQGCLYKRFINELIHSADAMKSEVEYIKYKLPNTYILIE